MRVVSVARSSCVCVLCGGSCSAGSACVGRPSALHAAACCCFLQLDFCVRGVGRVRGAVRASAAVPSSHAHCGAAVWGGAVRLLRQPVPQAAGDGGAPTWGACAPLAVCPPPPPCTRAGVLLVEGTGGAGASYAFWRALPVVVHVGFFCALHGCGRAWVCAAWACFVPGPGQVLAAYRAKFPELGAEAAALQQLGTCALGVRAVVVPLLSLPHASCCALLCAAGMCCWCRWHVLLVLFVSAASAVPVAAGTAPCAASADRLCRVVGRVPPAEGRVLPRSAHVAGMAAGDTWYEE